MAKERKQVKKYVEFEINFIEDKLQELLVYIKNRPYDEIKDRFDYRTGKNGESVPFIVATIESQRKDLTSALKEYTEISLILKELRKTEDSKEQLSARGSTSIPWQMRKKD